MGIDVGGHRDASRIKSGGFISNVARGGRKVRVKHVDYALINV